MRRIIPIASSCCFCFQLHQGFTNIIYFDIARLFWGNFFLKKKIKNFVGIIFALITFTKAESTPVDYTTTSFLLLAIITQTFFAFQSYNKGIPKNDYKIYRRYMISKSFYIFMNLMQLTFQDIFSCQIYVEQSKNEKCLSNILLLKIFLGVFWTIFEVYLLFVVFGFHYKSMKGFYGQLGSPMIFPDIYSVSQNACYKKGIILEVIGIKVNQDTLKKENPDIGFPLMKKQKNVKVI